MRREMRYAACVAGLPARGCDTAAYLKGTTGPARACSVAARINPGKDLTMHVQDTNNDCQGNRPRLGPALAKVGALAFAAACVPILSGWLIVTVLVAGIDS